MGRDRKPVQPDARMVGRGASSVKLDGLPLAHERLLVQPDIKMLGIERLSVRPDGSMLA
jgi:hypothetical protein